MKKTSFFLGTLFGVSILLSFWDLRFIFIIVLVIVMIGIAEYHGRPGKKNSAKARKILSEFEEGINNDFDNDYLIDKLLCRYPVRYLCYLRDGIKWQIFHHSGSDMLMTGSEERAMDRIRERYEDLLVKVEKQIPEKYLD